jgi:signal transduction histidine kinase
VSEGALREEAAQLARCERELDVARLRYHRALGWLEAAHDVSALAHVGGAERLVDEWPRIVVSRVKVQSAALFRVSVEGDALSLISYAGGKPPAESEIGPSPLLATLLAAASSGIDDGEAVSPLGECLGLRRVLWNTLTPSPGRRYLAAVGYDAAAGPSYPPFDDEDLGFSRMTARMLESMLGQLQFIGELTIERERLRLVNDELTRQGRELRRMQEELIDSTRLAAVGELAGMTAHEVLNPLTSIQGRIARMLAAQGDTFVHNQRALGAVVDAWAAALSRGGLPALVAELSAPSPTGGPMGVEDVAVLGELCAYFGATFAAYRDDLGFLAREIRRVSHIVDGMRGLSRRASPAKAELGAIVRESFEVLADSFLKRRIVHSLEGAHELWVEVDRYECIQVLANLLRNAMMAIEERGRGGGHVSVRVDEAERRALLHVEDDGAGILPENVPRLFEMRFSTRTERTGTGLGLCIARRLVRGWGGEIRLAWTRPGEGTCFLVELPLATEAVGDEKLTRRADRSSSRSAPGEAP